MSENPTMHLQLQKIRASLEKLEKALENVAEDSLLTKQRDIDVLLRTLLNTPLARFAVDSVGRLRVFQDVAPTGTTALTVANIPTAGAPAIGTANWYPVWTGPVDQRWEMIQRANIEYEECQRRKFTFV